MITHDNPAVRFAKVLVTERFISFSGSYIVYCEVQPDGLAGIEPGQVLMRGLHERYCQSFAYAAFIKAYAESQVVTGVDMLVFPFSEPYYSADVLYFTLLGLMQQQINQPVFFCPLIISLYVFEPAASILVAFELHYMGLARFGYDLFYKFFRHFPGLPHGHFQGLF
jgi:hypothetical protein